MGINYLVEKYLNEKIDETELNEASNHPQAGGGNLGFYTFWSRKPLIYVRDERVLFSNSAEFPTGVSMTKEEAQRARARGYILIDW